MIDLKPVATQVEFNRIHFFLLGNRLETLYLPSAIILTEGKCDQIYISKAMELAFPGAQFSIINATSDSRMKDVVHLMKDVFGDLQKSPYRDRIIAVLDSVHGRDIISVLEGMGLPRANIVVWENNGIEYVYPHKIIDEVFGCGPDLGIATDVVSRNGLSYKKAELVEEVVAKLNAETQFPQELRDKLFGTVKRVTGLTHNQTAS